MSGGRAPKAGMAAFVKIPRRHHKLKANAQRWEEPSTYVVTNCDQTDSHISKLSGLLQRRSVSGISSREYFGQ